MLKVDFSHHFSDFQLNVRFETGQGITAVFGPSGAGKTSVLNAIAGLFEPDQGCITVGGVELYNTATGTHVPPHQRGIGYVFQDARLFPHMSVARNIMYGAQTGADLTPVCQMLGIEGLLNRSVQRLSGGEKQRVAIARALMSNPKILVLDEPLASLDAQRRADILPYLAGLSDFANIPTIMVTHDMSEVAQLADHLVIMRNGRVVRQGATQHILSDASAVSDVGVRNAGAVLTATVQSAADDGLTAVSIGSQILHFPSPLGTKGARIKIRVVAQDVILAQSQPKGISALNVLQGRIQAVAQGKGPGVAVQIAVEDQTILARITQRSFDELGLAVGQDCFAILKATAIAQSDIGQSKK